MQQDTPTDNQKKPIDLSKDYGQVNEEIQNIIPAAPYINDDTNQNPPQQIQEIRNSQQ